MKPSAIATIEDRLERPLEGRGGIAIAHRPSMTGRADRIAVPEAGRTGGIGPHDGIATASGPCSRLLKAQEIAAR